MDHVVSDHPRVQAQLDRLPRLSLDADVLGLERIETLLAAIGNPQDRLPPVFHVAGTNGKGSTCAFLRAMIEADGGRVHAFTSPHLVRFNERIRVAGSLIGEDALADYLEEVLDASAGIDPSFFEVSTAAALLAFSRVPAEACILEVGLGGRLDATNVVARPAATLIATLGSDHEHILGYGLRAIAGEKAAIARRGVPLVTMSYPGEAMDRIAEIAAACGAEWWPRGETWDWQVAGDALHYRDLRGEFHLPLPGRLAGPHQYGNAALAVAGLRYQRELAISAEALAKGIASASWPARLQRLAPGPLTALLPEDTEVWLDGGHNPQAVEAVAAHFRGGPPLNLVLGLLATKDAGGVIAPLAEIAGRITAIPVARHNSHPPEELAALARDHGIAADTAPTLEAALAQIGPAAPARVLILGSLYLAGEVLAANDQLPD